MQYAYIRVSSADQNTARQEEALSKAGFQPDKICVEHASAKDTNRPGLQELLESSKRYLWHSHVATALEHIDDCVMYCDDPELNYANLKFLQKTVG